MQISSTVTSTPRKNAKDEFDTRQKEALKYKSYSGDVTIRGAHLGSNVDSNQFQVEPSTRGHTGPSSLPVFIGCLILITFIAVLAGLVIRHFRKGIKRQGSYNK